MQTLQKVSGVGNGPTPGTSTFQSDVLIDSKVHYIMVDNIPQNHLSPSPDYIFDNLIGEIDISPSTWGSANKLIVVYSQCQCN